MKRSLLAFALLPTLAFAQPASWQRPPKLVVGIVVDQMRADYIYRYWHNLGSGGFKRMIDGGAFLRDARYNYVPTETGPGHASIYSGTTPSRHGIVANYPYDRKTRKTFYCADDSTVSGVGTASSSAKRSPSWLLATTIADELELRTDRRAHTIGVALKDRASIMPIGRTGDAAYWYSAADGAFVTSTWYMKELPAWVSDFNAKKLPEQYLAQKWEALLAPEKYHTALPDDNPYEIPLKEGLRPSLPIDLDSLRKAGAGLDLIMSTPWGNTLTTDMAIAAIEGEGMGQDAITDLLAISYSATDILGHKVGPRAIELEDMYVRLDQEIARLIAYLDRTIGPQQYTVFLTADHAVSDVPAYLKDMKGSAGYVDLSTWPERIMHEFPAQVSGGTLWVDTIVNGQVYLRRSSGATGDAVARRLAAFEGVAAASGAEDLANNAASDGLQRMLRNGYIPERCGDVLFVLRPGFFEKETWNNNHGTTHGSPWTYDTHVPVIFYGAGVHHTEVLRPTAITDIAPTISAIIGMTPPNASDGAVVNEAVIIP